MKKITAINLFLVIFLLTASCYGKIEITGGYDNSFVRSKMQITEQGDTAAISFGPVNSNKELWFNFKITGVKNKTVTFKNAFENQAVLGAPFFHAVTYKPFINVYDNSYEMMDFVKWNEKECVNTHTFREDTAYVSFSYVASNTMVDNYIKEIQSSPFVTLKTIGTSKLFELPLYLLTVTDKSVPDAGKKTVFLWSREDTYEAGGTIGLLGALRFLLSNDPGAAQIRKTHVYMFVPIYGRDGTKIGHTNWPLDAEGKNYIGSIQQNWPVNKDKIKEVDLLMAFFQEWKNAGNTIDLNQTMHCNPFGECCFFFFPLNGEFNKKLKEYSSSLRKKYLPHYINNLAYANTETSKILNSYWNQGFFGSVAMATHTDSIFKKKRRPVEDSYQDGELLVRGNAEYFGGETPESVPPFLMAENTDKYRCKKGDKVNFSVFYKDVLDRKPEYIKVVIGGKSYPMSSESEAGYVKGVEFKCEVAIENPVNDYYIEASNGKSVRRMPETYLQTGPYIP